MATAVAEFPADLQKEASWLCSERLPDTLRRLQEQLLNCHHALQAPSPSPSSPGGFHGTEIFALSAQNDAIKGYIGQCGDSIVMADIQMKLPYVQKGQPYRIAMGSVAQLKGASVVAVSAGNNKSGWPLVQLRTARHSIASALEALELLLLSIQNDVKMDGSTMVGVAKKFQQIQGLIRSAMQALTQAPAKPPPIASKTTAQPPFYAPTRKLEALYTSTDRDCVLHAALPPELALEFYVKDAQFICALYFLQYLDVNGGGAGLGTNPLPAPPPPLVTSHHHAHVSRAGERFKEAVRPLEQLGGRIQHLIQTRRGRRKVAAAAIAHSANQVTTASATSLHDADVPAPYRAGVFPFTDMKRVTAMSDVTTITTPDDSPPSRAESLTALIDDGSSLGRSHRELTSPPIVNTTLVHSMNALTTRAGSGLIVGSKTDIVVNSNSNVIGSLANSLAANSTNNAAFLTPPSQPPFWFPFRGKMCAVVAECKMECAFGKDRLSTLAKVTHTLQLADRLCREWTLEQGGKLSVFQ